MSRISEVHADPIGNRKVVLEIALDGEEIAAILRGDSTSVFVGIDVDYEWDVVEEMAEIGERIRNR